jgi:magnesium chelatase family protein
MVSLVLSVAYEGMEVKPIIAERIAKACKIQEEHFKEAPFKLNSSADGEFLESCTQVNAEAKEVLKKAVNRFFLSMRGYTRVLRTIADLAGSENIETVHLAEPLNFRITKLRA